MYQRSKLKQTASALKSVPSWNLTPWRRWNVHCVLELRSARLEADEGLEELCDYSNRLAVRDERAVERNGVGCAGKDKRAAGLTPVAAGRFFVVAAAAAKGQGERGKEQQEPAPSSHRVSSFVNEPPGSGR